MMHRASNSSSLTALSRLALGQNSLPGRLPDHQLVVSAFVKIARPGDNPDIDATILDSLPSDPYTQFILPLVERHSKFYSFMGSMTTPGCEGNVQWLVFSR